MMLISKAVVLQGQGQQQGKAAGQDLNATLVKEPGSERGSGSSRRSLRDREAVDVQVLSV